MADGKHVPHCGRPPNRCSSHGSPMFFLPGVLNFRTDSRNNGQLANTRQAGPEAIGPHPRNARVKRKELLYFRMRRTKSAHNAYCLCRDAYVLCRPRFESIVHPGAKSSHLRRVRSGDVMAKTLIAAAAALAVFTAASAITNGANAGGGSSSAVKRTNSAMAPVRGARIGSRRGTEIAEFSSSSARRHPRNR